jgi:glycerol-3-phosphate cytidylyltransferase
VESSFKAEPGRCGCSDPHASGTSGRRPAVVIGYATGVFDLFHIGHLNIIRQARERCDRLIVGVSTDELVEREKGRLPVIPYEERAAIVASIEGVGRVVPQQSMDKLSAWEEFRFSRVFVGGDWRGSERWNTLEREFASRGVEVVYFPYTQHTSSTLLRATLGDLAGELASS